MLVLVRLSGHVSLSQKTDRSCYCFAHKEPGDHSDNADGEPPNEFYDQADPAWIGYRPTRTDDKDSPPSSTGEGDAKTEFLVLFVYTAHNAAEYDDAEGGTQVQKIHLAILSMCKNTSSSFNHGTGQGRKCNGPTRMKSSWPRAGSWWLRRC